MTNRLPQRSAVRQDPASREWFDALVEETATLDQLGVNAALLSIRLATPEAGRIASRARTLFGLVLRPTDRMEQTSPTSFSILLAPLTDLSETVQQANGICDALSSAGVVAHAGFAQRRPGESLLDTWARAEAQLDRASYRVEHDGGINI